MVEIAISVAAKIAEYLVAPVALPFTYLWNYKTNLESLKNEVKKLEEKGEAVQRKVDDARNNCEVIEKQVESWLEDVKKIIDEASAVGDQPENMQCFKGFSCTKFMKRYQHSKKAAKFKAVVEVQEEAGKFEKVSYHIIPEQRCLQPSKEYQTFESRTSILKDIIDALNDSDVNMVGIYGMGGVGKTTLAKEVAREAGQKNGLSLFDKIIFVEVSESPDIKTIQGVVAENLGLQFTEETVSGRANRLCDRLKKEEKILLILDNIWGRIGFEKIGIPIESDRRGLKLLLTTRNRNVLTNQMDCRWNFEVDALNKADAWSLFTSITGTFIEHPELNSIACEVAEECGGMPVAIVTLAEALKGQGQNEWRNALHELKNPSLKSFGGIAKEVYTSIKLSYDYLENEELKEIFLLCSCMGRTYDASVQDLFRYGLGLGLFENFNTLEKALCNVYVSVNKLKTTSLLLDAPKSLNIFDPPASEKFAMHDIIYDVAKSIANVFTVMDVEIPQFWINENTLRNCTSITLYNIDELPEDLELVCPQLKLLYVKLKDSSLRIPDNFFTMMLGLQVLHLIEISLQPLPTSISCLLELQTLCLDRCELGDITFIGSLNKLKILSFSGSDIEKLPEEMRHLTKLRLIDLTNCSKLSIIPPNVMSNLKKLEALYMGNSFIHWEPERPKIERSNVSIDELKHLCYLTMLEIHIPDAKMLKGLRYQKLEKYKIFIGDKWESWHWSSPSKTSRMLKLSLKTNEDENILQYLKGIEELELGELPGATNLFDALDRNGFPTLKHLDVDSNSHCSCIVESCDALPLLESLDVRAMEVLKKICNWPLGANSFLRLRTIRVHYCHNLNYIFSSSAFTILPQLKEIEVLSCENMEEIFAMGGQDDANNSEVVHAIEFSQLCILSLRCLSRLQSFCCKVQTDSPLQLTSDTQHREIISEEEMDICTVLFNEKVAFPNLQTLAIFDIHVEKIWQNLPPKISSCVQNLAELYVYNCGNLKELFSSSTVGTKESRVEEMRDTISFPKLNCLHLSGLRGLTTLWSGYYIEFPTLKEFKIGRCHQLDAFIFNDIYGFLSFSTVQTL
ncbi:hypothetical protein Ddye_028192 [Dipteronia dyeriana]|uniref:AAA+ ATPase domain-containing protein n=1 Tax=Dipteronia dyeriana TaxID=168575 RepID=A0AAD9WS43_9ROSI|nr:hypothetical protein Ddye_028192 [Dipteronia dyeriana]